MKKIFLTAVMTLFVFSLIACGASDQKSVIEDTIKAMDTYTADISKVKNADDCVAAINKLAETMKGLKSKAKGLPELMGKNVPEELKESAKKLQASMEKMSKATSKMAKYATDKKVQEAIKKLRDIKF